MIELLILLVLLENKCSIYRIRQKIEDSFSLFLKVSFGSIYPALKKLEKNKYVTVKTELSSGGQRKSLYTITEAGKEYFKQLMTADMPDNPSIANQILDIKMMALNKIESDYQKTTVNSILQYLQHQKINAENSLEKIDTENKIAKRLVKYNLEKISEKIQWLNSLNLN